MSTNHKLLQLEGFRGLAAFVVVIAHYMQFFYLKPLFTSPETKLELILSKTPLNLFYNANFAVCVFFVLSSYVLSMRFFREKKYEILYSSVVRRYFRLAIPVLFSVLVSYFLLVTNSYDLFTSYTNDLRYESMSHNFFVMIKIAIYDVFFNYSNTYNTVLWTMTYELFGSYLIFSFLSLFGRMKKRYFIYIILIIVFRDSYYLAFVLGLLLSDLYNSSPSFVLKLKENRLLTFIFFLIGMFLGSYPYLETNGTIYQFLNFSFMNVDYSTFYHIIGSFFLISAILNSDILSSFFAIGLFRYLGKNSFSLYLIHFPILASFSFYTFDFLMHFYSYTTSFVITFSISLAVIFSLSHFISLFIDEKGIKLSYYIYEKFFSYKNNIVE